MFTPPPSIFTIWFIQFIHIKKKNSYDKVNEQKNVLIVELFWEFSEIVIHLSHLFKWNCRNKVGEAPTTKPTPSLKRLCPVL